MILVNRITKMKIKCFAFMYSLLLTLAATAVTSSKSNDITWNKQAIFFINLGQFRQQFEDTNSVIYVESVVFDEVVEDIDLQNENSFTFCVGDYDPTYPGGYPVFRLYSILLETIVCARDG